MSRDTYDNPKGSLVPTGFATIRAFWRSATVRWQSYGEQFWRCTATIERGDRGTMTLDGPSTSDASDAYQALHDFVINEIRAKNLIYEDGQWYMVTLGEQP